MKVVSFHPVTPTEQLVANCMGNDKWEVLMEDNPWVKDSILICKEIDQIKHMRWIYASQVLTRQNV
jgi:hypothetical protein